MYLEGNKGPGQHHEEGAVGPDSLQQCGTEPAGHGKMYAQLPTDTCALQHSLGSLFTHPFTQHDHTLAGHLEAVDGETAPCLAVPVLQLADVGVVHVLLLLPQEVGRHCGMRGGDCMRVGCRRSTGRSSGECVGWSARAACREACAADQDPCVPSETLHAAAPAARPRPPCASSGFSPRQETHPIGLPTPLHKQSNPVMHSPEFRE